MNPNLEFNMIDSKDLKLWFYAFLYTCFVSFFIQLVLLPFILPMWHLGDGLLNTPSDSVLFHRTAVKLAEKIHIHGWSVWELRPDGHAPSGVATIFYYLIPKPWILIPFNAVLHASSALILYKLIRLFLKDQGKSVLCALPFLIFPSNLQWTAQLHKDSYSILGFFLILYSIVLLFREQALKGRYWYLAILRLVVFFIVGIFLVWIVRPSFLKSIHFVIILPFFPLFIIFAFRKLRNFLLWQRILIIFVLFYHIYIISAFFILYRTNIGNNLDGKGYVEAKVKIEPGEEIPNRYMEYFWEKSSWLPEFIENKARSLAQSRRGFRLTSTWSKSNIDSEVGFNSIRSILIYLPRAAQIVFLAPFPNQWVGKGTYPAYSVMRRVSALEMTVTYFGLIFLPYALWYWRKRIEIWIITVFCVLMMIIHGLVVCNIGTLYRMRYMYITTLIALGIAGFFVLSEQLRNKKENR